MVAKITGDLMLVHSAAYAAQFMGIILAIAVNSAHLRARRTHLMHLRKKLGEDGENPRYILAEPRVGYWMPEGRGPASNPGLDGHSLN